MRLSEISEGKIADYLRSAIDKIRGRDFEELKRQFQDHLDKLQRENNYYRSQLLNQGQKKSEQAQQQHDQGYPIRQNVRTPQLPAVTSRPKIEQDFSQELERAERAMAAWPKLPIKQKASTKRARRPTAGEEEIEHIHYSDEDEVPAVKQYKTDEEEVDAPFEPKPPDWSAKSKDQELGEIQRNNSVDRGRAELRDNWADWWTPRNKDQD